MKRGSGLKEYYGYIEDVRSGKVRASIYIKQMVERLEKMKQRSDIFFDEAAVEDCFEFIKCMFYVIFEPLRLKSVKLPVL